MAYDSNNLSAVSHVNGWTLWHYRERDEDADPRWPNYFDDAAGMLRPGDLMVVVQGWKEPLEGELAADVCDGQLFVVRRVKPHVVLSRIGG